VLAFCPGQKILRRFTELLARRIAMIGYPDTTG